MGESYIQYADVGNVIEEPGGAPSDTTWTPFDQQIASEELPAISNRSGFGQGSYRFLEASIHGRLLPTYEEPSCRTENFIGAGISRSTLGTTNQIAGGFVKAAAVDPEPISKTILAGIGKLVGFIGGIFGGHHAAAVAREQATLCAAIPATNQALMQIDSDFFSGKITKDQAFSALDDLYQNFTQEVQPVLQDTAQSNNEAGGYRRALRAEIDVRKQHDYLGFVLPYTAKIALVIALVIGGVFYIARHIG